MSTQTYQVEQAGNLVVASISARELTDTLLQEVAAELTERLRCHNASYFVLNLDGVEFMGSACLGVLVAFLQDLEHVRGRMALAHCHRNVTYLFKVTRLDSVFPLCDDVEQAKARVVKG